MLFILLLGAVVFAVFAKECKILVLSGGGAHGSFQAGVIKQLIEKNIHWDIITGISAGSLNGIAMSLYDDQHQQSAIELLEKIWYTITRKDVYTYNIDILWDKSIFDTTPLNHTIYRYLTEKNIGKVNRDIVIGAVNFNTGKLQMFYKENMSNIDETVQILMAAASVPLIFPPRIINNNYYVDGGLFSNQIIKPGLDYCYNHNFTDIVIDVISCDQPVLHVSTEEIKSYHLLGVFLRDYDIGVDALLNHALYTDCSRSKKEYPMYVYLRQETLPGGWFDFKHKDLVTAFEVGTRTPPIKKKYCI
jgi:predicted patatin/cPLA2 family phospholipase